MRRHIDTAKRKQDHTFAAIDAANAIDWPHILLVIYYPGMSAYDVAPAYYLFHNGQWHPVTRKATDSYKGLRLLFMPNKTMEEIWR